MHTDWFSIRLDDSAAQAVVALLFEDYGIESSFHVFKEVFRDYLCHSLVIWLQLQGSIFVAILGFFWLWAAFQRKRHINSLTWSSHARSQAPKTNSVDQAISAAPENLPAVSLVVPVKGVHSQSLENWRTILSTSYDGELELLFVVDSEQDPAVPLLQVLRSEQQEDCCCSMQVHIAPQATDCSQKIKNQMAGVHACASRSKYVLFLDDDIQLHPGSIKVLVDAMEEDSEVLVATGYPLDIPPPDSNTAAYCAMAYHLPLLVAFSQGHRSLHVWGGCMMLPLKELRANNYGIMNAFEEGGYSDDLILAALCSAEGRKVACPAQALFINHMDPAFSAAKYWNYLRRQIFVLYTYTSMHNWLVNTWLLLVHCYVSLGVTLPLLSSTLHLLLAACDSLYPPALHASRLLKEILILPTPHNLKMPPGDWLPALPHCLVGTSSAVLYLGTVALAGAAARYMVVSFADICSGLSPHRPPVSAQQIRWGKVFFAFYLNNLVWPFCALLTGIYRRIEWSGVVYSRTITGKVQVVERKSN